MNAVSVVTYTQHTMNKASTCRSLHYCKLPHNSKELKVWQGEKVLKIDWCSNNLGGGFCYFPTNDGTTLSSKESHKTAHGSKSVIDNWCEKDSIPSITGHLTRNSEKM